MARTINGNLTGQAAHGHDELDYPTQTAISRKIRDLKELMQDEFWPWYCTTSTNRAELEAQLDSQYFKWAEVYADVMAEVYALPLVRWIGSDQLATAGDWAADPRTPEQKALDDWCAEVEATRAMDYPI